MKALILLTVLGGLWQATAQTYVNVLTVGNSTNHISIPTNTLAKIVGWQGTQQTVGFITAPGLSRSQWLVTPVNTSLQIPELLGPCEVAFESQTNNSYAGSFGQLLVRLETVNTTPVPGGLVQAPGHGATIRLEVSTNLTTWQTVASTNYPSTSSARFFKTSLTAP